MQVTDQIEIGQLIRDSVLVLGVATGFLCSQITLSATATQPTQSVVCHDVDCSHSALDKSEPPGVIAEREGAKIADDVRKHGTDEAQWKSFILSSDSRNSKNLSLSLLRSEEFSMRLEPKTGLLHFQKFGLHQAFAIASPARVSDIWAKQELCPSYGIQVLSASSSGAVIVKYCQLFTDSKGKKFHI
jgi:hypothetical protein